MRACVRRIYGPSYLRPGGTISGPSMFALADVAFYVAVLAQLGPVGLAVTTNTNINFLRKPAPRDLIGEARLIKLGKRLAVGEVAIFSSGAKRSPRRNRDGHIFDPPPGRLIFRRLDARLESLQIRGGSVARNSAACGVAPYGGISDDQGSALILPPRGSTRDNKYRNEVGRQL